MKNKPTNYTPFVMNTPTIHEMQRQAANEQPIIIDRLTFALPEIISAEAKLDTLMILLKQGRATIEHKQHVCPRDKATANAIHATDKADVIDLLLSRRDIKGATFTVVVVPRQGEQDYDVEIGRELVFGDRGNSSYRVEPVIATDDYLDQYMCNAGLMPWLKAGRPAKNDQPGDAVPAASAINAAQTRISFDTKTGTVSRDSTESSIEAGELFNGTSVVVDSRVSDSFVLEVVLEKLRHGHEVTADVVQQLMRDVRERVAKSGSETINAVFVAKPN